MPIKSAVVVLFGALVVGVAVGAQTPPAPTPTPQPTPAPAPVPAPVPTPVPVTITGATSVPCYGFLRLELAGTFTSAGWMCFPDRTTGASLVSSYTTPNGHVFLASGAPGTYDIGVFAQTPTGIQTIQVVGTIQPLATPTPAPAPAPTVKPISNPFWAMAVFDARMAPPAVVTSPTLAAQLAALGGTWAPHDVNDPAVARADWITEAKKVAGPALVMVNQDGTVYGSAVALPVTEAAVIAAANAAKGVK